MANLFTPSPDDHPRLLSASLANSIDILNELIQHNAKRPESMRLLEKMLQKRAALQWVNHPGQNSLSG